MICPQCGRDNPDDGKFCGECGTRLERRCPACQTPNPPANKFCRECGQRLGEPAPAAPVPAPSPPAAAAASYTPRHLAQTVLASRDALEGERKQVTVLFTDVSGFTAMSARLDPEEVHGIMDRSFELILAAVHRYDGTINQFLGDGVMALFGAPVAHEDHPQRALRAALAIQEALGPFREELQRTRGLDFRVRIGVNTGLVVVGAIGKDRRMDYTAIGDTTNMASRLLNLAQPGQIAISRPTQRVTEGYFVLQDLGEFTVKGKAEPIPVWAVTGEIHGRTRLEVSRERGLTALVGRDRELGRLLELYREAAAGRGGLALVTGEPGVGKSRLLYEVLSRVEREGGRELEATCVSHGREMPYHPVLELIRRALDLPESPSPEEIREGVTPRLRALGLEEEEPAILLAHVLGATAPQEFLTRLAPAQLRERTFQAMATVLLGAAQPLVLVVENVHWLDASSDEFLRHLAGRLAEERVLLLLTTRPGPMPAWLQAAAARTVTLGGLAAADVRRMIASLFGAAAVAEPVLDLLAARSDGNPLYLEEIVRQLRETSGIVVEGGVARLSQAEVRVPDTVNDIIAARVDRLDDPLKQTLRAAAVVGRQFAVTMLSRLLAEPDHAVGERLGALQTLDFVFLMDEVLFSFKHALTQEVVYGGLLERRRRVFHAAVGTLLEELYAGRLDEVAELLAHHFGRSAEAEKAVDYALLAAEKAQRQWAHAEALAHFEAARKRLETMPDTEANRLRRIDAVVKQGEIQFALGHQADHVRALEAIRDLVESGADAPRRAAWYYWAGFLHSLTGARPELSIEYCRHAVDIADAAGLEDLRPFAECALAHVYLAAGDLAAALEAGEKALAVFEARGNVWWACRALFALSPAANGLGQWTRGLDYCRRALSHGQAVNDLRLKVSGWWRTGTTHIQRGDPTAGLRCCQEALDLGPIPFDAAMVKAVRGYGLVKAGDVALGVSELTEAVAWFERSQIPYTRALFSLWLAEAHLRDGQAARARAVAEEALALSQLGYRHLEGVAHRLLGEAHLGDAPGAAGGHLARAAEILTEVGARNELGKLLVAQAELGGRHGDAAGAQDLLGRALAIFEDLGTLDGPPRVRAVAEALAGAPDVTSR